MIRKSVWKKLIVILLAAVMITGNIALLGPVYAAENDGSGNTEIVSSETSSEEVSTDEEEELNDTETDLDALGFDTSELPEGYDPDSQDNPYGSEYTIMQEFGELLSVDPNTTGHTGWLYGDEQELNNDYQAFSDKSKAEPISPIPNTIDAATVAVAGDFKGKGRKSCLAYASLRYKSDTIFDLDLRIYDSEKMDFTIIPVKSDISIIKESIVRNLIDIDTGDYDGDGLDEIALIVPQSFEDGSNDSTIMAIYKIRTDDGNVCDPDNWKHVWSYAMPKISVETTPGPNPHSGARGGYNRVDIASGDISGDGIDDMILSWGRSSVTSDKNITDILDYKYSESVFLLGDKSGNMLRKSQQLSYGDEKLCRVAFNIGDVNGDGDNDVIMGGQLFNDAVKNNKTRFLGYYKYDQEKGLLLPETLQNMEVVADGNGYDDKYLSQPATKANLALAELYGKSENNCIYLDSVLYSYDGGFEIVDELDESGNPLSGSSYIEYNALSSYYAGTASQGLVVERYYSTDKKYSADLIHVEDPANVTPESKLIKEENSITSGSITAEQQERGLVTNGSITVTIDTDQDSALMRYTGKQTFAYSKPKVYAVLASAPYFSDLADHADGGENIPGFSGTSWGKSTGKGTTETESFSFNLGITGSTAFGGIRETATGSSYFSQSHSWTKSKNFSVNYSPIAGMDCVVFYSIPTAVYEYDVIYESKDDKGNRVLKTGKQYVNIPYQPATQTLSLEAYNEIQKSNDNLPVLDGTAITSKCGDPASYPSSSRGFKNATVYDGDWATPSYTTGGGVTQTISTSSGESDTLGGGISMSGSTTFDISVPLIEKSLGVSYGYDIGGSKTTVTSSGESASGTVHNPGPACDGYGYYFSWKLMTYKYETKNQSFPVVTYLTKDVTTPPALPKDFVQDHSNTTDSQIGLKWTYSDRSVTAFDIYRHDVGYAEGSNDVLVGTVNAGDYTLRKNKNGELVYDENGNTIKEYSLIDNGENGEGLSEYTEYEYRLQVRRSKVPPKSIPTKALKCKTRARYNPELSLSDSDLTVYYDTIKTVSVDVKESDSFLIKNKSFQWQKYNESKGAWEDINLADKNTYKFSKCSRSDAGDYRCRVNSELTALGNVYRITSYSETLSVKFSKRDVKFGNIICEEDDNITRFTLPVTNSGDGARTQPQGYVKFVLDNGQEKIAYTAVIDNTSNTATAEFKDLKDGVYELSERYEGDSKIFKDADNKETFTYMKNTDTGMWLSLKDSYRFHEDLMDSLKLYQLDGNAAGVLKRDITDQITKISIKTKVVLKYDVVEMVNTYAEYDLTSDRTAIIPCRFDQKRAEPTVNFDNIYLEIYIGDEKVADHKLKLEKGSCTLYLDDIEGDAGASAPDIGADDIRIKNADGYEDGDSPFVTPTEGPGQEAFTDKSYFKVGLYLLNGDFVGYVGSTIDIKSLNPGEYILKPILVRTDDEKEKVAEDNFFDIDFAESRLTLYGDTYRVTAIGETINGRKVGSVSMIAPDEKDVVENERYQGGTSLTFKAHPATSYCVKYWIVNESGKDRIVDSTSDTLQYIVRGTNPDVTIKAVFDINKNRLSAQTLGGGDNSTVECTSDSLGTDPIISEGKELSFKATAGSGYEFLEWRYVTVDGRTVVRAGTTSEDRKESTVKFTMSNATAVVYAVFQKQKATVEFAEHLTGHYLNKQEYDPYLADGTEISVDSGKDVPTGAELIIRPEKGYRVKGEWTVTGADYTSIEGGTAISITVPEDAKKVSVTADTIPGKYGISTADTVNADVSVLINGNETEEFGSVAGGSSYEFVAYPHRGYVFNYWMINGEKVENASNRYSGIVAENMNVEAVCAKTAEYDISTDIKGKGTIQYKIETLAEKTVEGTVDGTPIRVYEGENIIFTSVPDRNYMMSYIIADGIRSEHTDNVYNITNIGDDHSITFGFDSAISHSVKVENNTDYTIKSSEGRLIDGDITLGSGEECTLIISGVSDAGKLFVKLNGEALACKSLGDNSYSITFTNPDKDSLLIVDAVKTYHIRSTQDFLNFREALINDRSDLNAILECDIELDTEMFKGAATLNGTFDGNGHCIYGSGMDSSTVYGYDSEASKPIFNTLGENGIIKNLTIRDANIVQYDAAGNSYLLLKENHGKIENCSICNVRISGGSSDCSPFVHNNGGYINNCLVKNVSSTCTTVAAFEMINDPSNSRIKNSYVEGLYSADGLVTDRICTRTYTYKLDNCWYDIGGPKAGYEPASGSNAWINGKKSVGNTIVALNGDSKTGAWGGVAAENTFPIPISSGMTIDGKKPVAPVLLKYRYGSTATSEYVLQGTHKLKEIDGIGAWTNGTACYPAGTEIQLTNDETFEAIADPSAEYGYVVMKSGSTAGERYFKTIGEAVSYLEGKENYEIHVNKSATISSTVKIPEGITLYLEGGVKITVNGKGTLDNSGSIFLENDAWIINSGTVLNNKSGSIDGNGEKLVRNSGRISNAGTFDLTRVECAIHMWGEEQIVTEPTVSAKGKAKVTCEICGVTEEHDIEMLKESVKLILSSKEVDLALGGRKTVLAQPDPADCIGTVSWSSDNERVATVETSAEGKGVKAVLSGNAEGSANITATYTNEFGYKVSASMQCRVAAMTPITGISFDKEEYTMFEGATKVLRARIEPVDADEKLIWSSDDESIVTVDEKGVLTAESKGSANITVRAEGMLGGEPATATVKIRVIDESDISGDYTEIQKQLDALSGRVNDLTGQLDEAVQDISDQQTVLDSLVEKLETLDDELNDEATGLKEQMKKVQDELTSAKTEIDSLRSSVEDSVTEIENSKARISELETELDDVNTELANIKERQDLSEKEQKDLEEKLTAEQDKLQGELTETKTKLEEAINDIETNRKTIQEKSEALEKTISDLRTAEGLISDMDAALKDLAERTGTLEEGQQDLTESQKVLLENIDTMTADLKNLTSGLEGTAEELQKAKDQIDALEEAINELRKDVGSLVFIDSPLFDTESMTAGSSIRTIDFSDFAIGGLRPYVFSAEGLPNGITLTSEGVLSGKLSKAGESTKAVVTATDAEGTARSIEVAFGEVLPAKIATVSAKDVTFVYSGSVLKPAVTVKADNGKVLTNGTDYTVSAPASKNVGSYTLTVSGKGNYTGSKTLKYKINPKGTSISKLTRYKRAFKVTWKKQTTRMATSRITGYQVRYSTSSKMTNAKIKTVTGYSKYYKKISSLKAKTKYYVQVRTYKTVNGTKYYSSWSSTKYVTTK